MTLSIERVSTAPSNEPADAAPAAQAAISPLRVFFFAVVVGLFIFNVFACQVVLGAIAADLGLAATHASYVSTATLLGYALGLLLIVPLADVVENRRLVLYMALTCFASLAVASLTTSALLFLVVSLTIGAASSLIQVLVPLVGALTPAATRGRVLGNVMSGVMLGIMFSRPAASLICDKLGWRALYTVSAVVIGVVIVPLYAMLTERKPQSPVTYRAAVASLGDLLRREPVLRGRAVTAALVMGAFSMFWTAIAPVLTSGPLHLSARGVALFGLVGTAGAIAAPITGRLGDRGWTRGATLASDAVVVGSMLLALLAGTLLAAKSAALGLALLVVSAVLLDCGAVGDQTLGRRAINLLDPAAIGRRNGLFVGIFFLGGAAGSALVGPASAIAGWPGVCVAGALFGVAAFLVSAGPLSRRTESPSSDTQAPEESAAGRS